MMLLIRSPRPSLTYQADEEWLIRMLLPRKQSEEQAKPKEHKPRSQETPVSMETES